MKAEPHDPNTGAYLDVGNYSLKYLESLPTLTTGQADSLKIEYEHYRVWLSRCGVEDGEPYPNKVTVTKCNLESGVWHTVREYQAE